MLTYLLPTHNRQQRLHQALEAIGTLNVAAHDAIGGAEVMVVDNGSSPPAHTPLKLENGLRVRLIRLDENIGAAARNVGVQHAQGEWIVMLDDDSFPLDAGHLDVLLNTAPDVAAVGAEITLPNGQREAGGLPEVFIGCGVAIRREAFIQYGGYDAAFDYYAEEYDLCARLIIGGWRIVHDCRFRVQHDKISTGRDMDRILHRLVRNNCWVMQRYAPQAARESELAEVVSRYARIAMKESAARGFAAGMNELAQTLQMQPRSEMSIADFDRFTGLAHVRASLHQSCIAEHPACTVSIVDEGKNAWAIRRVLEEMNAQILARETDASYLLIGTLSPGPMLDAYEARIADEYRAVLPWIPTAYATSHETLATINQ